MDMKAWLEDLGLEDYVEAFAENGIDAALLPDLTNDDLKDLGVSRLADRKRILKAIKSLTQEGEDAGSAQSRALKSEGERRQVTVLFADIADFTGLSERLGAEATHEVLNRFFDVSDRIVVEFGGAIDKHIGDNLMAVFGAPVAHDNDPERAIRAALAIHQSVQKIEVLGGEALQVHIGIATGQVVASGTGSDSHREYTVTGDSVNLAARLQGLAAEGETLISEALYRRVEGFIEAVDLGPKKLKGIERPVTVWRVDGPFRTAPSKHRTPFSGRGSELRQCRAILSEVIATEQGQILMLRGTAGIGKSRLAEESIRVALEEGFSLHRAMISNFGVRKSQDAIPALVGSFIGLPPQSTIEEASQTIESVCAIGAITEDERMFLNDLLELPQSVELQRLFDALLREGQGLDHGRLANILHQIVEHGGELD